MSPFLRNLIIILFSFYLLSLQTSMAGMEIFGGLITLLAILHILYRKNKESLTQIWEDLRVGPDKWLWIFWLYVSFGAFYHPENSADIVDIIGECRWILLLYGHSYFLKIILNEDYLSSYKWVMLLVSVIAIYAFYQSVTGVDLIRGVRGNLHSLNGWYRATGMFLIPLTFAYSIGQFGLVGLGVAIDPPSSNKWMYRFAGVITFILTIVALQATQVRGSWLAMLAAVTVLLAFTSKKLLAVTAVILLICGGGIMKYAPHLAERVVSIQNIKESSNSKRLNIWRVNWEIAKMYPIIGVGLNQNPLYQKEMYHALKLGVPQIGHAHSDLLQTFVGTGIIGLILYLGFTLYFLYLAYFMWRHLPSQQSRYKMLAGSLFASQLFVHFGGLTQCNFTDGEVNHAIVLSWSVLIAIFYQTRYSLPNKIYPALLGKVSSLIPYRSL